MPGMMIRRHPRLPERAVDSNKGGLLRCPSCGDHFFAGGEVDEAKAYSEERDELDEGMDDVDEYSRRGDDRGREAGFARGGFVDGAGKVDGIHRHPSECSHLAAGGVCRHLAPSSRRPPGEDYADHKPRSYADGGFIGSLTRRRGRGRKES